MFFFRRKECLTDGVIDLIPVDDGRADPDMGFGEEFNWVITLHRKRGEIGRINLRLGESPCIYVYGHIGYHIDPPWRGHHYARRACRLIVPVMLRAGKRTVVITCDPDNAPSRATCEHLGCTLERTVDVPDWIRKRWSISRTKCRYIWRLPPNDS